MKFSTKTIHAGGDADPQTGAVMPPIYMTSTFALEAPGVSKGYEYTRAHNPNFTILEKTLAALEDAKHATVFSSGLGALNALISTLSQGDKVLALDGVYGGTFRMFTRVFNHFGITFQTHQLKSYEELEQVLKDMKPKWLMFETPTNPLLEIYDLAACAAIAKKYDILTIVDNTFATPYVQTPLNLGVDIVWHSTTKYIGGHSDVIGGAVISNRDEVKQKMDFARLALGVNPSPFDTWLLTRGVKTLALRMERHQQNALSLAQMLEKHEKVKRVYYPGLESHPHHAIAKKQMRGFGGMVSVEFDLPQESVLKMVSNFRYFTLAESLGGVESLVCHPATMTHASVPPEERKRIGLNDGLIRLSVGIEDIDDLQEDMMETLTKF